MLNSFITSADTVDATVQRYILVHGFLELGLLATLALPWHLHRTMRTHALKTLSQVQVASTA
jgi:hypothetical protein